MVLELLYIMLRVTYGGVGHTSVYYITLMLDPCELCLYHCG